MAQAKKGDTVRVNYTGMLEDGTVFDTSADRGPLEFTLGENRIISGFENAVVGMNEGESKTARVSAEDAYGEHMKEGVLVVAREQLPDHLEFKVGQNLEIRQSDDQTTIVRVTDVSDSHVTLDANHPLAGKDLIFEIELLEIV